MNPFLLPPAARARVGPQRYFPGYRSGLIYFVDSRIAVAVQANRDVAVDIDAIVLEIARRVKAGLR